MTINGYTLKSVRFFDGRNFIGFTANLYYGGKKIGQVTDTGNGCADPDFDIELYLDDKYREEYSNKITPALIQQLCDLYESEKDFKNLIKKHASGTLVCLYLSEPNKAGRHYAQYPMPRTITKDEFLELYEREGQGGKIEKIEVYNSLDDFNIHDPELEKWPIKFVCDDCAKKGHLHRP